MFFFFRRLSFKFFPCGASLLAVLEDNRVLSKHTGNWNWHTMGTSSYCNYV